MLRSCKKEAYSGWKPVLTIERKLVPLQKVLPKLVFFVRGSRFFLLHDLRTSYENLTLLCCCKLWDSSRLRYSWTRFEAVKH